MSRAPYSSVGSVRPTIETERQPAEASRRLRNAAIA
jgi:hypothetical protein